MLIVYHFCFPFSPRCRRTLTRAQPAKYDDAFDSETRRSCECCLDTVAGLFCNVAWLCCFCPPPLSHLQEESPLSVSSPDSIGTWIHYTCGVGTGRRRRRSGEQKPSSPVSPKSLAFTSSIFGSWQQVFKKFINYSQMVLLIYRSISLSFMHTPSVWLKSTRTPVRQINLKIPFSDLAVY